MVPRIYYRIVRRQLYIEGSNDILLHIPCISESPTPVCQTSNSSRHLPFSAIMPHIEHRFSSDQRGFTASSPVSTRIGDHMGTPDTAENLSSAIYHPSPTTMSMTMREEVNPKYQSHPFLSDAQIVYSRFVKGP